MKRYVKQRFTIKSKDKKRGLRHIEDEYKEEIFKKLKGNDYSKLLELIDKSERAKIENMRIHLFSIFDSPHHARRYSQKYNFAFIDEDISDKLVNKYSHTLPINVRKCLALETLKKIFAYTLDVQIYTHRYKENGGYYEYHIFIGTFKLKRAERRS